MENCFICKKIVIGLEGQDSKLDPYLLSESDPIDATILDAGAYGSVHLSCLSKSKWSDLWFDKRLRHYIDTLCYTELGSHEGTFILQSKSRMDSYVIANNVTGAIFNLSAEQIAKAKRGAEKGFYYPVKHELNVDLSAKKSVFEVCRGRLEKHNDLTLMDLIKLLGVHNELTTPSALEGGQLEPIKKVTKDSFGHSWLTVQASYNVHCQLNLSSVLE